tara:strand:+ start:74 stop:1417 length:1344 start_codon:yes stop_codon:yes gene_type:complete
MGYYRLVKNKISGFSKLSKNEKLSWLNKTYFKNDKNTLSTLKKYWNQNNDLQKIHDEFAENTISNFYLPFSVAPNFLIDGNNYTIPMVTEESSVVAAACKAAKFWCNRGGFKTKILSFKKKGHVHFVYDGNKQKLKSFFSNIKSSLLTDCTDINSNMKSRGGGILEIELIDKTKDISNYYQIECSFDTVDSMGANFINSCLEQIAKSLKREAIIYEKFNKKERNIDIIMCILSNYVPDCLVRAEVSCPVNKFNEFENIDSQNFVNKFCQAIKIAETQKVRAVTHNKGIMNGVDAVVIATGNDFRAIEAGVHAYAYRNGNYKSLTGAKLKDDIFNFWIEIPLSLGTVGGITNLHPLVKWSLNLLKNPTSKQLMKIVAVSGLAQNFAALQSLITTGIQKGHMKMHLINILNTLNATDEEKSLLINHFKSHTVTYRSVSEKLVKLRNFEI